MPGTWTRLQPLSFYASTVLLMTDGTVLCQEELSIGYGTQHWKRLLPDSSGSYARGTWMSLPDLPAAYQRMYYASAVLTDGRLLVAGGEYNGDIEADTTMGYI